MDDAVKLPDAVRQDLDLYLDDGEQFLHALPSASGLIGKLGELWLVLTDRRLYFHTREYGKESVVALLPRRDLGSVLYFQQKKGVTLTFTPKSSPQNTTRVFFPASQTAEVDTFCEELADVIHFQREGAPAPIIGPSTTSRPSSSPGSPPAARGDKASARPPAAAPAPPPPPPNDEELEDLDDLPVKEAPSGDHLTPSRFTAPSVSHVPPAVKKQPSPSARPIANPAGAPGGVKIAHTAAGAPPGSPSRARSAPPSAAQEADIPLVGDGPIRLSFVVLATALSLVVALLWYQLFSGLKKS